MAKKDKRADDCKKLGGKYDHEREICVLPTGRMLTIIGASTIALIIAMAIIGGITLYTASTVFNLVAFTWTGAFLIGLLVILWVWIYIKAKRMAKS